MFDILIFLFESYFDAGSYPEKDRLSAKLSAAGFEEDDIGLALDWLSGLRELSAATYPDRINRGGLRCYADFEHERISEDGLRFIAFWENNKIISPIEREMIIDRAVLRHEIAHVAIGSQHFEIFAQIFFQRPGLGGRLDDQQVFWHGVSELVWRRRE